MSIEVEPLSPKIIGQKLGSDVYNASGNVLLRQGVEIIPRYYSHFEKTGYRSIYLMPPNVIEVEAHSHLIPNQLLASMPGKLEEIFRILKHEDRKRAVQAKDDLVVLAHTLLENMNFKFGTQELLLDLKRQNEYLYQHSINAAAYAALIGKRLGYADSKLLTLTAAALLHDFGMVFIDPAILNKTEKLEDKEFNTVKEHTVKGFQHLFNYGFFDPVCSLASVQHHENFDGTGYPKQLPGKDIHEFSRIISLTDFFDAWTSDRPHRRLHSVPDAIDFIRQHAGTLFDPQMAQVLIGSFNK